MVYHDRVKPVLYCATTNAAKVREFHAALADYYEVRQLPGMGQIAPPEETGETFEENAALKAMYYSGFCEDRVFADDSGLEVDALGGAPGVHSARFAGEDATDADNNRLVLARMEGVAARSARFVCVIAVAVAGSLMATFRGTVEGRLLTGPKGDHGFGYDPLFYYPPFGCSFGEAELHRKGEVSHRGEALRSMRAFFETAHASDSSRSSSSNP